MKKLIISSIIFVSIVQANNLSQDLKIYLNELKEKASSQNKSFTAFDYTRGEKIFTQKLIGKKGELISCVSCHTNNLHKNGENISTGKVIEPLSPIANPKRFTKLKDVKKWLRRNFKDVYKREGTAQEKGDVITYIINQKG